MFCSQFDTNLAPIPWTITTLKVILSNADLSVQLFNSLTVSSINDLLVFPVGGNNKFLFQYTTFSYICSTLPVNSFPSTSPH